MDTRRRILIVDDDLEIRTSLKQVLEWEKYPVSEAGNGQEALAYLRSLQPSELPGLIILDLMMPVMDGVTFLEIIQREHKENLAKIPVVIATAKGSFSIPVSLPADVTKLYKPLGLDDVYGIAERYIDGK